MEASLSNRSWPTLPPTEIDTERRMRIFGIVCDVNTKPLEKVRQIEALLDAASANACDLTAQSFVDKSDFD